MKHEDFVKLNREYPNIANQLAYEMCCGFTGDTRYCKHFIKIGQYWKGECMLGLNPLDMEDWICKEHPLRKGTIEETPKEVKPPDISMWFDVND